MVDGKVLVTPRVYFKRRDGPSRGWPPGKLLLVDLYPTKSQLLFEVSDHYEFFWLMSDTL